MSPRRRRNFAILAGPLVTFGGVASYYAYFGRIPALRDVPWLNLPLAALGVAISGWGMLRPFRSPDRYRGRFLGPAGLVVSLLVFGMFAFYVFIFSYDLPPPNDRVAVGATAPDFTLSDPTGKPVSLSEFRGRNVVLVFYRGYW